MRSATSPKDHLDRVEIHIGLADLEKLCAQYAPVGQYRVSRNEEYHQWGYGGFREETTQLLKGDQPLVLSLDFHSWDTYSDDSEDHPREQLQRTYLLQDDPVARQMFDAIRTRVTKPQHAGGAR